MKPVVLIAAIFLSAAAVTTPRLVQIGRLALEMAPESYSARRQRLMPFYESLRQIKRAVPESESVAIILASTGDLDLNLGVFANYYLYPRRTHLYGSLQQYKDARTASSPTTLIRIDGRRSEAVKKMSYLESRREQIEFPIVGGRTPSAEARTSFFVPVVGSADGAGSDTYTTEAILVADADVTVTLTLYPDGDRKTYSLKPSQPLEMIDLVDQSFGKLATGWLQVDSSGPIRSQFWLVNRGSHQWTPLRQEERPLPLPQRLTGGEKLWVINPHDTEITVRINGQERTIAARGWWFGPAAAENLVEDGPPLFAFTSAKTTFGNTTFGWPERSP